MALQILKTASDLPDLDWAYYHYATVEIKERTLLGRILGWKASSVTIAPGCDPAYPVIQVIPPVWKQGEQDEWNILEQCYEQALHLAVKHHCDAVTIPLLTENDTDFPAYIDYKIAVDTIRKFLESNTMDVFLTASRQSAFQMPELRTDVERFLSRNFFEQDLRWSHQPFLSQDTRFNTIVPAPMEKTFPLVEDYSSESDYSMDFGFSVGECESSCQPCVPDWTAPLPPQRAPMSDRNTGVLPKIPDLPELDTGFSETLLKLIDKTGKKDSEIYNKANVSRQHFSKIRNNPDYKPTKPTAIAFAIALELDMEQTLDLIGRAGYTLTRSSRFDVIIMYFIEKHNYNMFDINDMLFEFDQSLLGA